MKRIVFMIVASGLATVLVGQTPVEKETDEWLAKTKAKQDAEMSQAFDQMLGGMLAFYEKPANARKMAKFQKTYFDALLAEGFTRDEALKIIVAPGFLHFGK